MSGQTSDQQHQRDQQEQTSDQQHQRDQQELDRLAGLTWDEWVEEMDQVFAAEEEEANTVHFLQAAAEAVEPFAEAAAEAIPDPVPERGRRWKLKKSGFTWHHFCGRGFRP